MERSRHHPRAAESRIKEYFNKRRQEQEPADADERLFGVPDALQPTSLEEHFLGSADAMRAEGRDEADIDGAIDEQARQYLEDHGIHEADDPDIFDRNYHLIRHTAYHNQDAWSEHKDEIGTSPQQYMLDDLGARYVEPAREASYRAMESDDLDLDDLEKESSKLAKKYGELLAKRANKAGLFERSKNLEDTKAEFEDLLSAIATEVMVQNEASGRLTPDQLNETIARFIDDQTAKYVVQMEQYRLQKSAGRNRVVKFVTDKWASWTPHAPATTQDTRLFSVQGVKQIWGNIRGSYSKEHYKGTLAKNAVSALGGAALATVFSPLAAAGVVGAGAAFVGVRAARVVALQKMNSAAAAERLASAQRQDIETRIATAREQYEADTATMFDRLSQLDADIANAEEAGDTDRVAELRAEQAELRSDSRSLHEVIADLTAERAAAYRSDNQKRLIAGTALAMAFGGAGAGLASHFNLGGHMGPLQSVRDGAKGQIDSVGEKINLLHAADGTEVPGGSSQSSASGSVLLGRPIGFDGHEATGRGTSLVGESPATPQIEGGASGNAEVPTGTEAIDTLSKGFTVEQGHGLTDEIVDTAREHGVTLTDDEAYAIHARLVDEVGRDYINLDGANGDDVYSMGGGKYEVGISAPGTAEWDPKAVSILHDELAQRGAHFEATPTTVDTADIPATTGSGLDVDTPASGSSVPSVETEVSSSQSLEWQQAHDVNETLGQSVPVTDATSDTVQATRSLEWQQAHDVDESLGQQQPGETSTPAEAPAPEPTGAEVAQATGLQGMNAAIKAHENGSDLIPWASFKEDAQLMNQMIREGDIRSINDSPKFQKTLDYIYMDVKDLTYPGTTTKIIEMSNNSIGQSQYVMNAIPEGAKIPDSVIEIFDKYAKTLSTLAP